jgi:hypothetical protein
MWGFSIHKKLLNAKYFLKNGQAPELLPLANPQKNYFVLPWGLLDDKLFHVICFVQES